MSDRILWAIGVVIVVIAMVLLLFSQKPEPTIIFDNLSSNLNTSDITTKDTTKVIGLEIPFVNNTLVFKDYFIVYNHPPYRKLSSGELRVEMRSSSNTIIRKYNVGDPRIALAEHEGFIFMENTNFVLLLPFFPELKKIDIYEEDTNNHLISIDLSSEIYDFCESINFDDPDCQELKPLLEVR